MEKTKVKINEHIADLVELGYVNMNLQNASCILKDLAEQTSDSLLKSIAKHLINEIDKHLDQLLGYVEDNYEFVKEDK